MTATAATPRAPVWRNLSVRGQLVLLVLAVLAPTLGFAGLAVWHFAEAERARTLDRADDVSRELGAAIERDFAEVLATARLLAASQALGEGDLAAFHDRAATVARILGGTVALRGPEGGAILDSDIAWGESLPPGNSLAREDAEAAMTGRPVVSDLHRSPTDGRLTYAVVLPVLLGGRGEATHFLSLSFPVARLQRILAEQVTLDPHAVAAVMDRRRTVAARTGEPDDLVGASPPLLAEATAPPASGAVRIVTPEGRRALLAYRTLEGSGWRVGVTVPLTMLDAPRSRALRTLASLGAGAVGLGLLAALLVGRRMTGALRALSEAGEALRNDAPVPVLATPLREANEVGAALAEASRALRAREAERAGAAAALRLTDERFRVALLGAPITAYTCDRDLRYTWIGNPRGEYEVTEALGRRDDELGFARPEETAALMALKRRVIETGRGARADFAFTARDGRVDHYDVTAEPLRDAAGTIIGATVAMVDVSDRVRDAEALRRQESIQRLLIDELNHRVKNTLASVLAIAGQTLRGAASMEEARKMLQARLLALAAAHDILTRRHWEGATLAELVQAALAPLRPLDPDRLSANGPPVWLPPRAALALALAFHELATNAVKYGAFANEAGQVAVDWTVDSGRLLRLRWTETGGPPVAPPARRGFGSRLIERSLAYDLGGPAFIAFRPEGIVCTIEVLLPPANAETTGPAVPPVAAPASALATRAA